jgi:two-component system chemotaxis sensor kinase CheA
VAPLRSAGRRASDNPDEPAPPTGRRPSDKVAVSAQAEASSIRVNTEKVDQLINLVGELVITQAMLAESASLLDPVACEKLLNGLGQLDRNTRDLQDAVMSIRMMPMSFVFSRFPRVVRDIAAKLGKEIELKTEGEATELDKGVIEKIADPLTHLVRNSVDHGIETAEVRVAAGKPARGTVTLRAFHQGGNIIIEVADDGAGLHREKILAKARERGMSVSDAMPDQDVWQLIFEAGFSTAATVTDVSGRGVGMDVVKRNIRALGGRVEIDSAAGHGTRIRVRLPLTLAILDGLSVTVGGELFIVPLTCVVESLQPLAADVKTISGRGPVVHVRGEYLPVVALHEFFAIKPQTAELHQGIVVIVEAEGRKIAMFVDALVGQHQVVIKSLETNFRRVHGVSGATIMGDGTVALILDAVAIGQAAEPVLAVA